ncbi:MAG: hypothetical protein WDZ72_10360 [Cyclobacteriaceae bacterium]
MFKITSKFILLFLFFLCTTSLYSQKSSDLILVDAKNNLLGFKIFAGTAKKITDNQGYDNQPKFINDLQITFSSESKDGNVEIILYNLETNRFSNMSRTENKSEFSPSLTSCGQYISAVTVEEDSSQRLWLYPINMGEPEVLYDDISPIGYYGWFEETAALFVIGEQNKLVFPYSREDVHEVAINPGRCIQSRPKTKEVVFLNKNSNIVADGRSTFELMAYHVNNREVYSLGLALGGSEDFCWVDKNLLLMARGKDIYLRKVNKSIQWEKVATISIPGYENITRLSMNPSGRKLVIVMEKTGN